jgi:hypothetical protein
MVRSKASFRSLPRVWSCSVGSWRRTRSWNAELKVRIFFVEDRANAGEGHADKSVLTVFSDVRLLSSAF